MKLWKKIVLGVVLVLVAAVAGFVIWQWDNIRAVYVALTQDSQQIAENAQRVREEHQEALQEIAPLTVVPPSAEQTEGLLDNRLTPEEVKESTGITGLLGPEGSNGNDGSDTPGTAESPPGTDEASSSPQQPSKLPSQQKPQLSPQELVNRCVAEMYACKIDLMAVLAQLKQEAVDQWNALPAAERTKTKKTEIGMAGLSKCYDLEGVVDDQIREILARYKEKLAEAGGDLTVIDTLWQYYEEEKATEKAYYIDKYMN